MDVEARATRSRVSNPDEADHAHDTETPQPGDPPFTGADRTPKPRTTRPRASNPRKANHTHDTETPRPGDPTFTGRGCPRTR
ncbi:hypothetical protein ABZT06_00200 [Streptomyces sp. NPDC005483]|uniref:hypothetical protein n=1 Tax=Streptomyces sp. NPDC005483 TaxID=3154882 RepID=UPI0033BAC54F